MSLISTYKRLEEYINTLTIYDLDPYLIIVAEINKRYKDLSVYTDNQLLSIHKTLKFDLCNSKADQEDVIEAFALMKQIAFRFLGIEAYDVQIVAGLVIYEGRIAEMRTGEGKTLAALFPTYLRAIEGKGIHVHTFNDYLSQRDQMYFKAIFDFLEMSSACINEEMDYSALEDALAADITYGSAKQFLYTYLKQGLSDSCFEDLSTKFHYAIIDEADAILLDEATNPFVIAGNHKEFNIDFYQIDKAVKLLVKSNLFEYTDFKRGVFLNERGLQFIQECLGIENLFSEEHVNLLAAINLSLHANVLLKRDQDYIVYKDEILLVDEFTGRVVMDRKWRNGLQTAVEAKERVKIQSEGSILNSISIPNFYKQYKHIGAMTATAKESAGELEESYGLVLVVIPPNLPSQRIDHSSRVFRTSILKYEAILKKIIREHRSGRPILIGTQHINESEWIYEKLQEEGIECEILNAKNDQSEAQIVAKAGTLGSITISTNMAGRGTDIKLGGEEEIKKETIEKLGGLLVIGTNMHRSGRIDRQLKGRAGRQGEIGESQMFVSLEDELFDKNKMKKILPKKYLNTVEDEIKDGEINKYLSHAQEVAEDQDMLIRSSINSYSEITYFQSQLVSQWKRSIQNDAKRDEELKRVLLSYIDHKWADTISQLFEVKDGIHFISLGGQNPLRAYRIIADEFFASLEKKVKDEITEIELVYTTDLAAFEKLDLAERPSSTSTYTLSDKGFNKSIEALMKGNSQIAFQLDIFGLSVLFFKFGWIKIKELFNSKSTTSWK